MAIDDGCGPPWLLTTGDANDQPGPKGAMGREHRQLHPTSPEGRQKGVVQPGRG